MRQQRSRSGTQRAGVRGFTLMELVVATVVLSVIAMAAVPMLQLPISSYMQNALRADLQADANTTIGKLRSDLAQAVPNTIRVQAVGARWYVEYLEWRA